MGACTGSPMLILVRRPELTECAPCCFQIDATAISPMAQVVATKKYGDRKLSVLSTNQVAI
jgi:hypothetical protein